MVAKHQILGTRMQVYFLVYKLLNRLSSELLRMIGHWECAAEPLTPDTAYQ